jgi:integrase
MPAIIEAANRIETKMARLLNFLLYTGCRICEARALKWESVGLGQRVAYIQTSKNDDPRSMQLRHALYDLLQPRSAARFPHVAVHEELESGR